MKYRIDNIRVREDRMTVSGWAVGRDENSRYKCCIYENDSEVESVIATTRRDDISRLYFGHFIDLDLGFTISFPYVSGHTYVLHVMELSGEEGAVLHDKTVKLDDKAVSFRQSKTYKRMQKITDICSTKTVKVTYKYLQKHGLGFTIKKIILKLTGKQEDTAYADWYELTKPTKEELDNQRSYKWDDNAPLFSIVIPVYATPDSYLKAMIDSLLNQTYSKLEVCISDGSPEDKTKEALLKEYAAKDSRVKYKIAGHSLGISENTNEAIKLATGDYVVLCDHDDEVPENALYECAMAVTTGEGCDCFYSDEDKLELEGGLLTDPNFKPDYNIDMLCSVNYICHLFGVRRDFISKYGDMNSEFNGAQDYDFIFRMTEHAGRIVHIPKVLYHWRCHIGSTASNPASKMYAFTAGGKAIEAHYKRVWPQIKIAEIRTGVDYGIYHTVFELTEEPLVSVIIPNKDHSADLDVAIRSLLSKGTYKNLEFIVVENNSTEKETWTYYDKIQKELPQVHVVKWDREFNYSAINNFGVAAASGEYLLLMNNDVELIAPDSLKEMMGYAQRPDVGAVGCKLLYQDDSIQHAGVVVGFGGIAGHTFIGQRPEERSYFQRSEVAQDYSAVTAACMLTKKSIYNQVGGFSEELAVAFNDIDYCMKVRAEDKLIVYTPYASFHHYESKSRGLEDTPEKVDRFNREIAKFMKKWPDILRDGDPYYNPNLTLNKSNFVLRDLKVEQIGEPYHMPGIDAYLAQTDMEPYKKASTKL